jgi:exopolysaccharide production protein ExoQ
MNKLKTNIDHSKFLESTNRWLLIILFLMVVCFFTWSENIIITRVIKVIGRMGILFASYLLYKRIINYGAVDSFKWNNTLSILLYAAYLGLGFVSFLWSTNVTYSALQWFMTSQTLIFCFYFIKSLYLLDTYFPDHKVKLYSLVGNSAFALILIFVVGMWVDPDTFIRYTMGGEESRLGGFLMNPNELGMLAGVGIAGLIFELKNNQRKFWVIVRLMVLFYGLYATGSRSSLIGAFLIIGFHLKQSSNQKIKVTILALMLLVVPFAVYTVILKGGDSERLEEVMSMTGRLPFWKALINESLPREPLLGYGFMRIDYNEFFQGKNTYPGKMTHNTFMQALMNLGFIGLTIVLFQMLFTFYYIFKENEEKKLMLLCFLIPLIINSFTEFGIFGESNFGILYYQIIIMYISLTPKKALTSKQKIHLMKRRTDLILE